MKWWIVYDTPRIKDAGAECDDERAEVWEAARRGMKIQVTAYEEE